MAGRSWERVRARWVRPSVRCALLVAMVVGALLQPSVSSTPGVVFAPGAVQVRHVAFAAQGASALRSLPPDLARVARAGVPERTTRPASPRTAVAPRRRTPLRPARSAPSVDDRVRAALALIDTPWRHLGYELQVRGPRAGILGMSDARARTLTLHVRPDASARSLAFTLAHEVAHVVDYEVLTQADRDDWLWLRGLPADTPWYTDTAEATDLATGAGDFAECFAVYEAGLVDFRSGLAGPPTSEQLTWLSELAARVGELA